MRSYRSNVSQSRSVYSIGSSRERRCRDPFDCTNAIRLLGVEDRQIRALCHCAKGRPFFCVRCDCHFCTTHRSRHFQKTTTKHAPLNLTGRTGSNSASRYKHITKVGSANRPHQTDFKPARAALAQASGSSWCWPSFIRTTKGFALLLSVLQLQSQVQP